MLHADPEGAPEQLSEIAWLKPPAAVAVSVNDADCPAVMVADDGENETPKSGVGAVVPVPLKVTACGLPGAESVIVTEPERGPVAVGVKITFTVQFAPGLTVEQLLV